MKKSDSIALSTIGAGAILGIGAWIAWPDTPWYVYLGLAVCTLLAIPKAIKTEAEQKIAKRILDE